MPKILRIINRLNIGGPTYNVAYLSKYLDSAYQTRILSGIREPYEGSSEYVLDDLGLEYEYVADMHRRISLLRDSKAYQHIRQAVNQYQPDIVHTHAAKAGVLGRLAAHYAKNRPKAIVHTYHGNVFDGYFSPLKTKVFLGIERYLCSLSQAIVAISDKQKDDLVNKYGIAPAGKVHVIRLGFDLERFAQPGDAKRAAFRRQYQLPDNVVAIAITGRLTGIKNHTLFIQALGRLRAQHPAIKFRAFVVGDGELRDDLMNEVRQAGFTCCQPDEQHYNADIIFTSWRKDIDVINAGADVVALTSLNEGTPVSIIEAMASGTSVICTDVGGVKDVVKHGETGLLPGLDAGNFAQELHQLICNQPLRMRLAAAGKAFALQHYTFQRLINETENLYQNLLY